MLRSAQWTVEIFLDGDEWGNVHAEAFLLTADDEPVFARGVSASALGSPGVDARTRAIAARTVAARALADLAHSLMDAGAPDATDSEGMRTTAQREPQSIAPPTPINEHRQRARRARHS